jgi:hypothetical protein
VTELPEERVTVLERNMLRIIIGSDYESDLGWRLRYEERFELLDGPDIVKYIKVRRLQWADHMVQMDNSRLPEMVLDETISWKVTCEKNMTEVGRKH